ncbi:MAG: hypothetical protein ACYDHW_07620 [Syntrophorhabdaceae bacterium]
MKRKIKKSVTPESMTPGYKTLNPQGSGATVRCRWCGKSARIIPFGYGYIAACCDHIIYSDQKLPDRDMNDNPEVIPVKRKKP